MPGEEVFDDIEYLMEKLEKLQNLMLNKEVVSLRVVTTPEQIVLKEAKRNVSCLYLYNYNVDAIIVNRIYPNCAMEGYFNKWIEMQEKSLRDIKESFHDIPCFYVELLDKELCGISTLKEVAATMYGEKNPNDILFQEEIYKIDSKEKTLRIYLPFAEKAELSLISVIAELLFVVISTFLINALVILAFDRKGDRRNG